MIQNSDGQRLNLIEWPPSDSYRTGHTATERNFAAKYFEQICANVILSMEFLGVGGIGLGRPYHAQLEKSLQFGMADWDGSIPISGS